jgi:hypothetical protein
VLIRRFDLSNDVVDVAVVVILVVVSLRCRTLLQELHPHLQCDHQKHRDNLEAVQCQLEAHK